MNDAQAIRVAVMDAWEDIDMTVSPGTAVGEIKRRALDAARITAAPASYLVKFRGAEVRDESQTLTAAGVPPGGALIVMARHRRAVR